MSATSKPGAKAARNKAANQRGALVQSSINIGVAVISAMIGLVLVEVALRLAFLSDPWTTRNFTVEAVDQARSNLAIAYDPALGYIAKPNLHWVDKVTHYSQGDLGVRLNATYPDTPEADRVREGGILAVGDSFVYGSEVDDDNTWPAQLERLLHVPVINGGNGGYGWDQAYLRAEQLAPVAKPKVIIMGCIPNCSQRNELTVNGGLIKPNFRIENGGLILENVPVKPYAPARKFLTWYRYSLGRSYTLYWLADRLQLRSWWLVHEYEYQYTSRREGVEITCLLTKKLAELAKNYNALPVLLIVYSGIQITGRDASRLSYKVPYISNCARSNGVLVVDSYDALLARYANDKESFWNYWVDHPTAEVRHNGHMSKAGNAFIADLIVPVIADRLKN
jgi:lysophospholipase L1-like esterase